MNKKVLIVFALVSLHISESRILPRGLPEDESSGNGEMSINPSEKDRKLGIGPGIFGPPEGVDDLGGYDYDSGVNKPQPPPTDYDFGKPEEEDNGNDINKSDKNPERLPSDEDHWEPPLKRPIDKDEDEDKKYDEEKPVEENDDSSKDDNLPPEENSDKPIHSDGDDSNTGEETDKKEDNDEESEEKGEDEDKKEDNDEESEEKGEDEDKKDYIPDAEENGDKLPEDENEEPEEHDKDESSDEKPFDGEEAGFFESGGSIFDTPFFNLEQVKKYFSTLDRALGHVFRQTLDEARLLNGTYANTTEEEVEIDGKKYIVQKSVIQGADNHSSIYVEALSSKPQLNDTEETKSNEITNSTEV